MAADSSAKDPAYFGYYAQFVHQQNMLQDSVRTNAYHRAITESPELFKDKLVMDVGAGSGILSYFAAQTGAKHVYAVEASFMSERIKKMVKMSSARNKWMNGAMTVVASKIEDPGLKSSIPKVDAIISEPIGVLLVHERMIESFLYARDHFLKPGGTLLPNAGTIHLAPFSDVNLWAQSNMKVRFWEQSDFYGVDFSPLAADAKDEVFGQPVVGYFDSRILLAPSCAYHMDYTKITMHELQYFTIPISWTFPYTGKVNLSTSPMAPNTHWQQVRFLFREPLAVNAFEVVTGHMKLSINEHRSYDISCEIVVGDSKTLAKEGSSRIEDTRRRKDSWKLHEQTYWYDPTPTAADGRPEINGMYPPYVEHDDSVDMSDIHEL